MTHATDGKQAPWTAIRTGAIAGWSAGAVLAVATHTPLMTSVGAGVLAGLVTGAAYALLSRVLAVRATR
jgi:hypothetical protein